MNNKPNLQKRHRTLTHIIGLYTFFSVCTLFPLVVHAGNQYAQSAASWILDGLFWVILVGGMIGVGGCIVKRNLTAGLVTFLGTAVVAFLINDAANGATVIKNMGNTLRNVIGL